MTLIEPGQSPLGQGMLSGHGISQDAVSPGDAPRLPGDGCRRRLVRFMHRCIKKRDETRLSLICCSCIKWILLFVRFCLTHPKCPGPEIPANPAFFFSSDRKPTEFTLQKPTVAWFCFDFAYILNIPTLQSSLATTSAAPGAITTTEPLMETSTTSLPLATTS